MGGLREGVHDGDGGGTLGESRESVVRWMVMVMTVVVVFLVPSAVM